MHGEAALVLPPLSNLKQKKYYQIKTKFMSLLRSRRLLVFALFQLFIVTSCSKKSESSTADPYTNSPSSPVPGELQEGIWFWGNIGPIAYYDRDGHQVGNETEAAREYRFSEVNGKGRFEFTQYLGMRNASNCVTEIYTTKKGSIQFEGTDKLTLFPVEGSFRTVKSGCNAGTSTTKASPEDLKAESYLWELISVDGDSLLYVYEISDTDKQDPIFVYSFAK